MSRSFQHRFEWNPAKAKQNVKKHGVAFERAATIFLDPNALSEFDEEHSKDEDRWMTLGLDMTGALLVVCHTYHAETESSARIRLISARKASSRETAQYRGN